MSEAISELKREIAVRERCFDKWVADGRLTDVDAQDRFDRMASALMHLCNMQLTEQGLPPISLENRVLAMETGNE